MHDSDGVIQFVHHYGFSIVCLCRLTVCVNINSQRCDSDDFHVFVRACFGMFPLPCKLMFMPFLTTFPQCKCRGWHMVNRFQQQQQQQHTLKYAQHVVAVLINSSEHVAKLRKICRWGIIMKNIIIYIYSFDKLIKFCFASRWRHVCCTNNFHTIAIIDTMSVHMK